MGGKLRFRAIERDAAKINRPPPRTRRRRQRPEKPIGPRLVRGRGYARRRMDLGFLSGLIYLLIAAATVLMLVKYGLVPFMNP